ncbi:hypothetical protein TWF718_008731 [Orbilia javanica]|uniref:Uncharacterized protein n=1 Tax=Orbilia javanica TaxID=47235 RepID=A0AAN8MKF7_9PEZI
MLDGSSALGGRDDGTRTQFPLFTPGHTSPRRREESQNARIEPQSPSQPSTNSSTNNTGDGSTQTPESPLEYVCTSIDDCGVHLEGFEGLLQHTLATGHRHFTTGREVRGGVCGFLAKINLKPILDGVIEEEDDGGYDSGDDSGDDDDEEEEDEERGEHLEDWVLVGPEDFEEGGLESSTWSSWGGEHSVLYTYLPG